MYFKNFSGGGNGQVDEYAPKHFRNHDQIGSALKLNDFSESKLENMDQKLKTIEDLIIDETIKYTGAHEGYIVFKAKYDNKN